MRRKTTKELSGKEKLFCSCFVSTGNMVEAAIRAGYRKNPEIAAERLLSKENILAEIETASKRRREAIRSCAFSGYERLAFGNVSDAVRLIYISDPTKEQLERMDLFNVAEIKRPKDGSVEIKFFDRVKALEKLEEISDKGRDNIQPFYQALEQGTIALNKSFRKDENA